MEAHQPQQPQHQQLIYQLIQLQFYLESTSTLTWSSTNATSCSASWTNQTGSSGSEAVTILTAGNNSFSITCTGAGGSRSATVTVEGYREY